MTELGQAGQENIWLVVRAHRARCNRSVRPDLEPNVFPSDPFTQSLSISRKEKAVLTRYLKGRVSYFYIFCVHFLTAFNALMHYLPLLCDNARLFKTVQLCTCLVRFFLTVTKFTISQSETVSSVPTSCDIRSLIWHDYDIMFTCPNSGTVKA